MALESNRPVNSVHSDHNGVWEGAAWGLGAGAAATGMAYGSAIHGTKHLARLRGSIAGMQKTGLANRNARNIEKGRRHYSEEILSNKINNIQARADNFIGAMERYNSFGKSIFGGKRAMVTGTVGLMGGMLTGAGIDALNNN